MIWCVEDDASILDIEVYTLQSTGFQAQGFADGGAFWSALESARELPELVVLDVMLPGVDGVELLRRMLHETIYNLCDNAIGYNVPGGSVRVTVSDAGENAVISVADTGIGIAPEHQSRIFERFYRVDKSHSKASGGTGLGLSIVKHAAAYHHGTVQLESQPGKGTTITVTIPKKKP